MSSSLFHEKEGISFNVNQAKSLVYLAGGVAEAVAKKFLLENPLTSKFLASHVNHEMAIRVIQSTLPLLHAFDDKNGCTDQEKQKSYLQFVTTMTELSQSAGDFSRLLKEKNVMNTVCESIGRIIYNRPAIADQIKTNVEAHVSFMRTAWTPNQPQLAAHLRSRL